MPITAPTRLGTEPNRAGREGVSQAMGRLLDDGHQLRDPDRDTTADELRSWSKRLSELAKDLADCIESPVRNRIVEMLSSPSLPDDLNGLYALRLNVSGQSVSNFATDIDIAGPTVERIEEGNGCHIGVAKKVADAYALAVTEMFFCPADQSGSKLYVRTVGGLREAIGNPDFPITE